MIAQVITENGQKKIQPLSADTGTGAPVGSYLYLEKKSNPQGYLYCDGSTFDSTAYPALYQYLGTNVLPDFREFSPVGAEQNTTNVYDVSTNPNGTIHDHDVYTEGQAKDDQLQEHTHKYTITADSWSGTQGSSTRNLYTQTTGITQGVNGARVGTVTRGKRKAVFVYIKATSGLTENQQENVLNTINDNLSYSTTEHKTGKKWIDGKPIYRKVVNYGVLPNNTRTEIAHNITNIENVIKAEIIAKNAEAFIISNYGGNTCSCYITQTKVSVRTDTDLSSCSGVVVIEYTKTTD